MQQGDRLAAVAVPLHVHRTWTYRNAKDVGFDGGNSVSGCGLRPRGRHRGWPRDGTGLNRGAVSAPSAESSLPERNSWRSIRYLQVGAGHRAEVAVARGSIFQQPSVALRSVSPSFNASSRTLPTPPSLGRTFALRVGDSASAGSASRVGVEATAAEVGRKSRDQSA